MTRDRTFVAKPEFRSWLLAQLAVDPIVEPLVTYVARRVAHAQATNGSLPGATTMAPAQPTTNGHYDLSLKPEYTSPANTVGSEFTVKWKRENGEWKISNADGNKLPQGMSLFGG